MWILNSDMVITGFHDNQLQWHIQFSQKYMITSNLKLISTILCIMLV